MDEISMGEKGRQDLISIANNHGNQSFGILSSAHDLLKALPGMDELKARKLIYGVVNSTNPTTTTSSSSTNNNSAPVSTVPSASTSFQVNNFKDLCHLSQRDLKNLFGPESGSRLFRFIHDEVDRL
ncbi:hypothetical protein PCASD_24094 [Puccinia coronata f. sp. avenae]|nr:hypothetical protein PCASD_24094 [Puccinia coronata f. sp. avenae]